MLTVGAGLAILYALMLFMTDGAILFERPFWVDEVWTVLVSSQDSPADVIRAIAAGADGGSGLVHLTVWALQKLFGEPSPVMLRSVALLCVFTTLCVVYAVLRRRFSGDASVAGMLAVGTHYLIVSHAFEGRFYGPWILSCALFALALGAHQTARTRRTATLLALTAAFQTLVHFYGVFTLGVMTASVVVAHGRRWRDGVRLVVPAAAGFVAFAALIPLAISVRSSLAVPTWVPDFEIRQLRLLAYQFWIAAVPLFTAVALVVGVVLNMKWRLAPQSLPAIARHVVQDAGIVALAGLAVMPLALTAVTLAGQASMLSRYHIATVLAWAPFVALTAEFLGKWPARIARVVFVGLWFATFVRVTFEKTVFAGDVEEAETVVRRSSEYGIPVVFQSVHAWYPVWARDHTRAASLGYLDMSDETFERMFRAGTVNEMYNRGLVLDRGIARVHSRRFGIPRLVPEATLDTTARFILVAAAVNLPVGFQSMERFARTVFPNHRLTMLDFSAGLLELGDR